MRKKLIFMIPAAIVGIVAFMAIGGTVVAYLWNWLLPPMFGWHAITFWQALGLLALCRILFGGFSGHGRSNFRRRMKDRCESMSPEERERFRETIRARWGGAPSGGESQAQ